MRRPVIAVRVVDSFEDGLRFAHIGVFGLTAAALTNDPAHIELAAGLDAGVVTINGGGDGPEDEPFEPARSSGIRRPRQAHLLVHRRGSSRHHLRRRRTLQIVPARRA